MWLILNFSLMQQGRMLNGPAHLCRLGVQLLTRPWRDWRKGGLLDNAASIVLSPALSALTSHCAVQVIPKAGGKVKVLLGPYAGETAVVVEVLKDDFVARLDLDSGKEIIAEYEHFSKLAS